MDYPDHLLAREAAPPFDGEGPFALWHFSEDPSLDRFLPRALGRQPGGAAGVGGRYPACADVLVSTRLPARVIWPVASTTAADCERFFGQSAAARIHVMEAGWLKRLQDCRLYAYRLPTGPFRPHEVGGYWVADEPVDAIDRVVIDDLAGRHARAGIELRVTPSIWPFWRRVAESTVGFSGSRLSNSAAHPDRLGPPDG